MNADFGITNTWPRLRPPTDLNYTRLFGGSYVEVPGTSFGIERKHAGACARGADPALGAEPLSLDTRAGETSSISSNGIPEYFRRLPRFSERGGTARRDRGNLAVLRAQYGEAQWKVSPLNAANNVNRTSATDYKKVKHAQQ